MPILYINKPKGFTSFDVCNKLKRVLMTNKIGHTGTLDPNATGVLVVLYDNATKANQFLVTDTKEYITKVKIGIKTSTLDIDGTILEERNDKMPSKDELIKTLNSFLGAGVQIPPMTSAIKVNGKKLYQYQRNNQEVELPIRDINIYEIELLDINDLSFTFRSKVSSGTYIRALVRDICNKLSILGTVVELTRTAVDNIRLEDCDNLDMVVLRKFRDHSLYEVLSNKYETIDLEDPRLAENGRRMKFNTDAFRVLITSNKKCVAMYEKDGTEYKCIRGLK